MTDIKNQFNNSTLNNPVFIFGDKKHLRIFLFIIVPILSIGFSYLLYQYQVLQQPLQLTVALKNNTPNTELPPANGLLTLAYGDKIDSAKNVVSQTIFKGIPANFRNKPVHLSFDAKGFIHRDTTLVLPQEVLYLPIARDNSLGVINGRITDFSNNQPLEGVKINVQELVCYTDSTGMFLLHIPFDKQRINQRISTFLNGYKPKEVTTPVIPNEPVMLNLEKY